jgi:hypothetical protein
MAIGRDDPLRAAFDGAFQDSAVGFVIEDEGFRFAAKSECGKKDIGVMGGAPVSISPGTFLQ